MAEQNDIRTIGIGQGLVVNNKVIYLTMNDEILKYLGTTTERLISGTDKLVEKFDYSKTHKIEFLGVGKKI